MFTIFPRSGKTTGRLPYPVLLKINGSCDLRTFRMLRTKVILHSGLRRIIVGAGMLACTPAGAQPLERGDIAVIGINANNGTCSGNTAEDEISFICFKNLLAGARIWITDQGYEYQDPGMWGTSEGVIQLQRSAGLPLGTVTTLRINSAGTVTSISAGWVATTIVAGMNLNSGGDQIFFFQALAGATFTGSSNDGVFTNCTLLYGFSTRQFPNDWVSFQNDTQYSGLPPNMTCFAMAPASSSDWIKYIGPTGFTFPAYPPLTQRQWIIDIDDNTRWASQGSCATYNASSPNYAGGFVFPFTAGTFVNGRWTGAKSTDWFDCRNWDDAEVPTITSNVFIHPLYAPVNNCVIGVTPAPPPAVCAALTVQVPGAARSLTIQNNGSLQVAGNMIVQANSGNLGTASVIIGGAGTPGTLNVGGNLSLNGSSIAGPQQSVFVSTDPANTVSVAGNLTISPIGFLDLSSGVTGSTFQLGGDYANNATIAAFDEPGSTVIFNGSGPQSITTGTTFQEEFGNLTVNNLTNDLTLNSPVLVKTTLSLLSGRIFTNSTTGLLTLSGSNTTAVSATAYGPSFVHGPMVKTNLNVSQFRFPVGKGLLMRGVSVIGSVVGGPSDAFIAEYFPNDPHTDIGPAMETPPLLDISYCEYYRMDRYVGTPSATVTLGWNTATNCGVFDPATVHLAKWDGTMWRDRGSPGTGSVALGTVSTTAPIIESNFTGGGWWTLATVSEDNPLPIELLSFDAHPEGSMVRLDWHTATERDNDFFTIERSANGHDFEDLARVEGAGNSTAVLHYTDLDRWPLPGTSFYRLRQTDFDGASTVSTIVTVRMPGKGPDDLVILADGDHITGLHDFVAGSTCDVLDMTGRVVWQGRTAVDGRTDVPFAGLSGGAYVLRVSDGTRSASAPFVR